MKYGNWVPMSKALLKLLPKDREFSEIEATLSLQCDLDEKNKVTVAGYASLWRWSRKRVANFLKRMNATIEYPKDTTKKQNQRGQIALQIRNRYGTDMEQIRLIDSKCLEDSGNRCGTDKEQIGNRSGSTTKILNNKNNNNPKDRALRALPTKKKFEPPTEDEVIAYFEEKGYTSEAAIKAHQYYDAADWKDSRGNQVKNWKQKMIAVWFKDENKDKSEPPYRVGGSNYPEWTG